MIRYRTGIALAFALIFAAMAIAAARGNAITPQQICAAASKGFGDQWRYTKKKGCEVRDWEFCRYWGDWQSIEKTPVRIRLGSLCKPGERRP